MSVFDVSSTLLYISASPCGANSTSRRVASAFLRAYEATNPEDNLVHLDLWDTELPPLDAMAAVAHRKILTGEPHTEEEAAAWHEMELVADQFKAADKLLIACPMWSFHIPYRLKHYLDLLVQPGLTFSWTRDEGYKGLVTGHSVQLILTRAGRYSRHSPAAAMDHQTSYLKFIFEFLGFSKIRILTVEPTWLEGREVAANKIEEGFVAARDAGRIL